MKKAPVKIAIVAKSAVPKPRRPYPFTTLTKALQVAQKIKELNGGNPWAPSDLAEALGIGRKSPNLFYITAASRDFGLTIGTREAETIALAELGREIVYAPNIQVEREKKIEAFLRVGIFKKVLDHYKGSTLPEMKYLGQACSAGKSHRYGAYFRCGQHAARVRIFIEPVAINYR